MGKFVRCFFLLITTFVLTGCYLSENGYLCALNTPEIYCDKKVYEEKIHPGRSIDRWDLSGRTEEKRLEDWVDCGGTLTGGQGLLPLPNGMKRTVAQGQADSEIELYKRQRCMLAKKYEYIGPCYDNEISRPQPACRARRGEPWK